MRLDAYLVDMGYFKSRGRSKSAVHSGSVKVNGTIVKKVSKNVSSLDEIEVAEGLDMPMGYFKLKRIQEECGILQPGDRAIDLGSSAGGFLTFASEIVGHIKGIEFSREFRSELGKLSHEKENVDIMFGNVFTVPLKELSEEPVDVILSDMTLDPEDSIKGLEKVLPLLKEGGKLLQVIKIAKRKNPKPVLSQIEALGLEVLDVFESKKQEIYIIARKPEAESRNAEVETDKERDLEEEVNTETETETPLEEE